MGLAVGAVLGLILGLGALALYDRPDRGAGEWLKTAGLEPRDATVLGMRVRCVRTGSGPPVILLHGFGSSLYTWKDVLPGLQSTHDVLALDFPGFGQSDQPAGLTLDLLPGVVLALMDQLGWPRATLVGSSLGGAVAAILAGERPERVDRLVLIDAAGFNLSPENWPAVVRLITGDGFAAIAERLPMRRVLVTLALRQVFYDPSLLTDERLDEYLAAAVRPGTLASMRSLARPRRVQTNAVTAVLPAIVAPTLVVWGRDDAWIRVSHADRFAGAIRGARKVVLDRCGHLPQEEKPLEVTRLLLEFLAAP
jgi:pimeloyl-ACP methyl ester carboxylesterase